MLSNYGLLTPNISIDNVEDFVTFSMKTTLPELSVLEFFLPPLKICSFCLQFLVKNLNEQNTHGIVQGRWHVCEGVMTDVEATRADAVVTGMGE